MNALQNNLHFFLNQLDEFSYSPPPYGCGSFDFSGVISLSLLYCELNEMFLSRTVIKPNEKAFHYFLLWLLSQARVSLLLFAGLV